MLHHFFDDRPWFAPKRFGYGAGLPIAWQGWVFVGLHAALVVGLAAMLQTQPVLGGILIIVAAIAPLPIYARRTRGGWKWRTGSEE